MAEQHANRDVGRVREAAGDARGQHLGQPGVERQPAALGELQHHDGDERLHDAAGTEPIGAAHRCRPAPRGRGRRRRSSPELRALDVQDRSREGRARIAQGVAQRLLELDARGRGRSAGAEPPATSADPAARAGPLSPAAARAPAAPTSSVLRSTERLPAPSAKGADSTSGIPFSFPRGNVALTSDSGRAQAEASPSRAVVPPSLWTTSDMGCCFAWKAVLGAVAAPLRGWLANGRRGPAAQSLSRRALRAGVSGPVLRWNALVVTRGGVRARRELLVRRRPRRATGRSPVVCGR